MKCFAVMFSFYLLALAIMPCTDNEHHVHAADELAVPSAGDNNTTTQHTEKCSPFCICSCCGTSLAIHDFQTTASVPQHADTQKTMYQSNFISEVSFPIWHPPKFS
jgi:hypothetical protein